MAIAPPPADFGLWPDVQAKIRGWGAADGGWVPVDEDAVRTLAAQWTDGGAAFDTAFARDGRPAGFVGPVPVEAWPDDVGFTWTTKRFALTNDVQAGADQLRAMAAHVTAFADDVVYAKQQIVQTIQTNLEGYGTLTDPGDRDTFATEVARGINTFLDGMAGVVGRAGESRPAVDIDPDDLDGWGAEEWADVAGVASAGLSVAALAFPPAALVLGGAALITGAYALSQHTNEYLEDPSLATGATVLGDAASLVPGVGAAVKLSGLATDAAGAVAAGSGLSAATQQLNAAGADAFGSSAPIWTDAATGLGVPPAVAGEVGTGIQGATTIGPQLPTVGDLATPGSQSEYQTENDAATSVYGSTRVVEAIDAVRQGLK